MFAVTFVQVCETLIPKSHDMKDGEARASYMLHMLESAGLKSRHCEVTTQIPSTTNLDQLFSKFSQSAECNVQNALPSDHRFTNFYLETP